MSADRERNDLPTPAATGDAAYDAAGKSPDQIEQDIAETRGQLGAILDALEHQLAPRRLLDRGVDMLKDTMSGAGGGSGVADSLRRHPVPLALVGVGLGWMAVSMTGRGRLGERMSGALHNSGRRAGQLAGQVRDKVAGMTLGEASESTLGSYPMGEARDYAFAREKSGEPSAGAGGAMRDKMERAQSAGSAALAQASGYVGSAGDRLHDARDGLSRLIEEHPIAVGALGLLAGAVMAALLPRSDAEERLVGPAGEQLRDRAAGLGRQAAERAQQVAERTVDAATDAARQVLNDAGHAEKSRTPI
jgi:hypothetical protein